MTAAAGLTAGGITVLDADLGDALARGELGPAPVDLAGFELAFMAAVLATDPDPDRAWDSFYDNSLARVRSAWGTDRAGAGTLATFSRIWSRAAALSQGSTALDVGTCFGLLPLAWAAQPGAPRLLAADLCFASASLAGRQARRHALDVAVVCADGARLPLPDRSVDTVHLLHVLEHLSPPLGQAVLDEALRVADRRVVVAVPVETVPDPLFGHVRTFGPATLAALGRRCGWTATVTAYDGAWLVLDRP